jgi:hypothetical protein
LKDLEDYPSSQSLLSIYYVLCIILSRELKISNLCKNREKFNVETHTHTPNSPDFRGKKKLKSPYIATGSSR